MKYAFYEPDGRVVQVGSHPVAEDTEGAGLTPPAGLRLFIGDAELDDYILGGKRSAIPPEQRAARPSYPCKWDPAAGRWQDLRPLPEIRAWKWNELKRARLAQEFGKLTWDGATFDIGMASQMRLRAHAQRGRQTDWTLADNTTRTMKPADFAALVQAMDELSDQVHAKLQNLRQQVFDPAATGDAIRAIAW